MKQNYRDEKWIGQKFNRLTVIAFEKVKRKNYSGTRWIVRCDCGTLKSVEPKRVISGHTMSCGCLKAENTIEFNKRTKVKHGGRQDRLYTIWHNMKQRCYGITYKDYPQWGGRGICVCDEWKDDVQVFYNWATENGYRDGLTIDRKNNDGNYCPENCRWATMKAQANNRRSNVLITYNGKTKNMQQWASDAGIPYQVLWQRISKLGWSADRALTEPVNRRKWKR